MDMHHSIVAIPGLSQTYCGSSGNAERCVWRARAVGLLLQPVLQLVTTPLVLIMKTIYVFKDRSHHHRHGQRAMNDGHVELQRRLTLLPHVCSDVSHFVST